MASVSELTLILFTISVTLLSTGIVLKLRGVDREDAFEKVRDE